MTPPRRSGSPWLQSNTVFSKYAACRHSLSWNPPPQNEGGKKKTPQGLGLVSGAGSYRVRPLQLQREGGRVRKVPGFHSPPGGWHRLGVRGHGGTTASSINRKWVWLQDRCCTLLVGILSQQPGQRKEKEGKGSSISSCRRHRRSSQNGSMPYPGVLKPSWKSVWGLCIEHLHGLMMQVKRQEFKNKQIKVKNKRKK